MSTENKKQNIDQSPRKPSSVAGPDSPDIYSYRNSPLNVFFFSPLLSPAQREYRIGQTHRGSTGFINKAYRGQSKEDKNIFFWMMAMLYFMPSLFERNNAIPVLTQAMMLLSSKNAALLETISSHKFRQQLLGKNIELSHWQVEQAAEEHQFCLKQHEHAQECLITAENHFEGTESDFYETAQMRTAAENDGLIIVRPSSMMPGSAIAKGVDLSEFTPGTAIYVPVRKDGQIDHYIRLAQAQDGSTEISCVLKNMVPSDFEKDEDEIYSDFYERIYSETKDGQLILNAHYGSHKRALSAQEQKMIADYGLFLGQDISAFTADGCAYKSGSERLDGCQMNHDEAYDELIGAKGQMRLASIALTAASEKLGHYQGTLVSQMEAHQALGDDIALLEQLYKTNQSALENGRHVIDQLNKGAYSSEQEFKMALDPTMRHYFEHAALEGRSLKNVFAQGSYPKAVSGHKAFKLAAAPANEDLYVVSYPHTRRLQQERHLV
jgi:hypothetical protein